MPQEEGKVAASLSGAWEKGVWVLFQARCLNSFHGMVDGVSQTNSMWAP